MTGEAARLTELGRRFIAVLNAREFDAAGELYARDAFYESPALADREPGGRIVGREQIIRFFVDALDGDDDFRLDLVDSFVGIDLIVLVSTSGGRAFVDVLRTDDTGSIVEHLEVSPKRTPLVP